MGYKEWAFKEMLTSSDLNNLSGQTVMRFASAAARSSALTAPVEGMVSYLEDTNFFYYYTGSAWAMWTGRTAWVTVTGFGSGWRHYNGTTGGSFGPVKYRKSADGIVHLQGLIQSTVPDNTANMFTLPSGYRPDYVLIIDVTSSTNTFQYRISIDPSGVVSIYSIDDNDIIDNQWFSLSGISFHAA